MDLNGVLEKPHVAVGEICIEMIMYLGAVWIAFLLGLLIGWLWKPKWAISRTKRHKLYESESSTPIKRLQIEKPKTTLCIIR